MPKTTNYEMVDFKTFTNASNVKAFIHKKGRVLKKSHNFSQIKTQIRMNF
jgi:hypothetical protein